MQEAACLPMGPTRPGMAEALWDVDGGMLPSERQDDGGWNFPSWDLQFDHKSFQHGKRNWQRSTIFWSNGGSDFLGKVKRNACWWLAPPLQPHALWNLRFISKRLGNPFQNCDPPKAATDSATAISWQTSPSPYFCLWPWPLLWRLGLRCSLHQLQFYVCFSQHVGLALAGFPDQISKLKL